MTYYYLAASLPLLSFDVRPDLELAAFLALCAEHLGARDVAVLTGLLEPDGPRGAHRFVRQWRERLTQVGNAVARARAARAGRDPGPYVRAHEGYAVWIQQAVAAALARGTPLERERELDRIRWGLIEELSGFDAFSIEAILAYALKLRIAERWGRMDEGKGRETVAGFVAGALGLARAGA